MQPSSVPATRWHWPVQEIVRDNEMRVWMPNLADRPSGTVESALNFGKPLQVDGPPPLLNWAGSSAPPNPRALSISRSSHRDLRASLPRLDALGPHHGHRQSDREGTASPRTWRAACANRKICVHLWLRVSNNRRAFSASPPLLTAVADTIAASSQPTSTSSPPTRPSQSPSPPLRPSWPC